MESKYKIGDVVKIVGNTCVMDGKESKYHHLQLGTYAIVAQENCGDAMVLVGLNTTNRLGDQIVYACDIERVEIK